MLTGESARRFLEAKERVDRLPSVDLPEDFFDELERFQEKSRDDIDVNVFLCGNKEIDDYFHNEALLYGSEMLSRNFVFITDDGMCDVVSMFSLCNYSIDMTSVPGSIKNRLQRKYRILNANVRILLCL